MQGKGGALPRHSESWLEILAPKECSARDHSKSESLRDSSDSVDGDGTSQVQEDGGRAAVCEEAQGHGERREARQRRAEGEEMRGVRIQQPDESVVSDVDSGDHAAAVLLQSWASFGRTTTAATRGSEIGRAHV